MAQEYIPEYAVKDFFHVGYVCDNPKECAKWYEEMFGFKIYCDRVREDIELLFIQGYGIQIELLSRGNQDHGGTFDHICFEVVGIEKMVEALKTKGVKFETEQAILREGTLQKPYKFIYCRGPVNERIELFEFV